MKNEGISIEILGPLAETMDGEQLLPWLDASPTAKTLSGNHITNGNSVMLGSAVIEGPVQSEVNISVCRNEPFGSDDYISEFFDFIQPVVSVISSDEKIRFMSISTHAPVW